MKLVNIGFGNMVSAERIIAAVSPESAPIKRVIQDVRDRGQLIDASFGRSTSGPCHGQRTCDFIIVDAGGFGGTNFKHKRGRNRKWLNKEEN